MSAAFRQTTRAYDHWRVNGYGYPCFFSDRENAREAWSTLLTFFDFADYGTLKDYWDSPRAPRKLKAHAVESWKAAFEEFGILFVESGSNKITITPAGAQLRDAAERDDRDEFAWVGLNLLLRYPLRGPRGRRSGAHQDSDLLVYRFLYAALLDLDGYIWWTELERILCRVFHTNEVADAIADVRTLRQHPELITQLDMPVNQRQGAFYNSLNQVAVHAGMNHLLLGSDRPECPYGVTEPKRRHFMHKDWSGMIRKALSHSGEFDPCGISGLAVTRIPAAPDFADEVEYFEYLGAAVTSLRAHVSPTLSTAELKGERVFLLSKGAHYERLDETHISGAIEYLCQLTGGQRLILSDDERWTYLLEQKSLIDANNVKLRLRRARPISNIALLRSSDGETDA